MLNFLDKIPLKKVFMDKFDEWNEVKKATNAKPYENIKISEKNIYWVKIGQNVGSEIYGKGEYYTRPVLVLKKFYIKII